MLYDIDEIEKKYPNWYSKDSEMSRDDQQWIWENLPSPQEEKQLSYIIADTNAYVNGSVNGGYGLSVDSELNWYKSEAIRKLNNYDSSITEIQRASYLTEVFKFWKSFDGHWLFIAQTYTLRTINWVINETIKYYISGAIKTNPAKYFTYVVQKRTKRKTLTATIGGRKQEIQRKVENVTQ